MAYNSLRGDRGQPFPAPPDLRDWLPEGHLAWFVLDVVDQLDLAPPQRAWSTRSKERGCGAGNPACNLPLEGLNVRVDLLAGTGQNQGHQGPGQQAGRPGDGVQAAAGRRG
jgi:hypothetical protein